VTTEKSDIHNRSVHVVEQSEQRQQKIRHLEAVRYCLIVICILSVSVTAKHYQIY